MFGEGPAERRERLKELVSRLTDDEIARKLRKKEEQQKREEESQNEVTWYHEGTEELRLGRIMVAEYSLRRARDRLANQRALSLVPELDRNAKIQETYRRIRVKWRETI